MKQYLILVLCVSLVSVAMGKEIGKNLRVVWLEGPQHAARVVWDGNTVDEGAVLLYGTAPGKCTLKAPLAEAGRYGSSQDAATKHREIHYLNGEQHGPEILYFSGEGIWQVTRWKNGEKCSPRERNGAALILQGQATETAVDHEL